MTPAARLAASIELLSEVMSFQRPADAVANNFFRDRRYIGGGDRRAISARIWDILRHWKKLEWWLAQMNVQVPSSRLMCAGWAVLSGQPFEHVQALFSGGRYAPDALTNKEKMILAGLVGRTLEVASMPRAVRLEMPEWLMPLLEERFGKELEKEAKALLQPASLDIRVNLLKTSCEKALAALAEEKIMAEKSPLSPWGIRIDGRISITSSALFRSGDIEIQDEGSQLIALLAEAQPGQRVMDYCAGAGGKTLGMAMAMQNQGHIVACDVSSHRLEAAVKRLRRAGVHNVERHLLVEGDKWLKRQKARFDRVLVDAPCTGTGTWRRNPDGRLRLTQTDLDELKVKQRNILQTASRLVKPGGRLIYATCSLLSQENQAQVEAFLQANPDFQQLWLKEIDSAQILPEAMRQKPFLELTPASYGTDGFFCSVLQRQTMEQKDSQQTE
ncbi:RsmB/NOP family class I SAM-dependent RNA methyltransferase [Entomobacter blattae]|uniref:Ribosomal RNA small subunit methyltransferase B n=1 Tax=Entomobacter blattae TaxID=2762277 RepID=A0A7H1NSC8_9PROT|nr:RsmB/NOP family class I SAM-dependent RNA methyltransferase [Entomobacter blattae]QNT78688.1 Ribosomal RNA small subunit methyltransferase B [Entomobacter blattae]